VKPSRRHPRIRNPPEFVAIFCNVLFACMLANLLHAAKRRVRKESCRNKVLAYV